MDKCTLPVAKLKDFLSYAKNIETDRTDTIPALKCIKFEIIFGNCILTKANYKSFIRYEFDTEQPDMEFLIEEKRLIDFCNGSSKENVIIHIKDNHIHLTDGVIKQKINKVENKDYPELPEEDKNAVRVNKDVISSINSAKVCLAKDDLRPSLYCVHLKDKMIISSSGFTFYMKTFQNDLPEIHMTKDECDLVGGFEFFDYSLTGNYNTYKNGNKIYGFRNMENASLFDYEVVLRNCKRENHVKIKTSDFINFNNNTISFANQDFIKATLKVSGNNVTLSYQDLEMDCENVIDLITDSSTQDFEANFNPEIVNPILKSLPYDHIFICNEKSVFSIWNELDKSYFGMVGKVG